MIGWRKWRGHEAESSWKKAGRGGELARIGADVDANGFVMGRGLVYASPSATDFDFENSPK